MTRQYNEAEKNYNEIQKEIIELRIKIRSLPVVKADVIKYPHHAFVFEKKDWGLIDRIDKELNPYHIIYQTRNNRHIVEFDAFLKTLKPELQEKFIDSAKFNVKIITLEQFTRTFNSFIKNEGEAA